MTFGGRFNRPMTPIILAGKIQISDFLKYRQSTCFNALARDKPEKNNKCKPIIGSQLIGEPATKSIKGKPKAAPPKPKPVRTKPVQQKIIKTHINCVIENSISLSMH